MGRVGIVTHGSLRVRTHNDGEVLKPLTIGRYTPGKIIGHGESDGHITSKSNVWFQCFDEGTEVVFVSKEAFDKLWGA